MEGCPARHDHDDGSLPLSQRLTRIEQAIERGNGAVGEVLKEFDRRVVALEQTTATTAALDRQRRQFYALALGVCFNTVMLIITLAKVLWPTIAAATSK